MNIEKIKEALEEIINQDTGTWDKPVPFSILHRRALDIARAALAELEKPAAHGPIYVPDAWEKEVDRIAESYHAKKCAECWRVPRVMCSICGDPIIVGGVCENCVPEIIKNA